MSPCFCCKKSNDEDEGEGEGSKSWLPGCFKRKAKAEEEESPQCIAVATIEEEATRQLEQQASSELVSDETKNQHRSLGSSCPTTPTAIAKGPSSRRASLLVGSTSSDISNADVRLGLFEEERFRDVSEAIFKKHS